MSSDSENIVEVNMTEVINGETKTDGDITSQVVEGITVKKRKKAAKGMSKDVKTKTKSSIVSELEKQRLSQLKAIANQNHAPDVSTDLKKEMVNTMWNDWWDTFCMACNLNLQIGYQTKGRNLGCGSISKQIFDYMFSQLGCKRKVISRVRKGVKRFFIQFEIESSNSLMNDIHSVVYKTWVQVDKEKKVSTETLLKYSKLLVRLDVSTNIVESDFWQCVHSFDKKENKWIAITK